MMDDFIRDYTNHLKKALAIGKSLQFNIPEKKTYNSVLICGLGGSGIGGTIVSQLVLDKLSLPVVINKDYHLPAFVNPTTLVICCSYSGNTEETLYMLNAAKEKGAEICLISSGGKFETIAQEEGYNFILIPSGLPPRAAFGLSFPQLFFAFHEYGMIDNSFIQQIENSIKLIEQEEKNIIDLAKNTVKQLGNKLPIIYCESRLEGVAVRFRQQLNENSKSLAWHNVIPEMNHNELVGWKEKNEQVAVIFLKGQRPFYRNEEREQFCKSVIQSYCPTIIDLVAKGKSSLEETLYLVHLGDWISFYLAEIKKVDPIEIEVIIGLKDMLSKID